MSCVTVDEEPQVHQGLPLVSRLPVDFCLEAAFARLRHLPHCLWLDSAAPGPRSNLGRYSFLTADPIETLVADSGHDNPWPQLERWCQSLAADSNSELPPFQGGIAGLVGYEAATWLEPVGAARTNDLPTPAMSLGRYDWTIAVDHLQGCAWIISQGFGGRDQLDREQRARQRLHQVQDWLRSEPRPSATPQRPASIQLGRQYPTAVNGISSNLTSEQYRACVAEIVRRICDGDSFQVNLAQRLLAKATSSSSDLYVRLRKHNPAPFGAYYAGDGFEVVSSSPEGFLKVRNDVVETRPIKGTVPRTGDPELDSELAEQLLASEKDRAENVMIVDLMRNDLSRVCDASSIRVRELCAIERYQYVQHLVSVVEGRLAKNQNIANLLQASFPGGSITGAPKIEAMKTIARLEPNRRGPYCGTIGYISCGGNADFNILIRTITAAHGYWQIPVGGGITARSEPVAEEAETWAKAEGMLRAIVDDG
ncbi:MAG: anthranilate synthase component I family protein [Rubripirellula sp.]